MRRIHILNDACKNGDSKTVREVLDDNIKPSILDNRVLLTAIKYNNIKCAKLIIDHDNFVVTDSVKKGVIIAAKSGNRKLLKNLLYIPGLKISKEILNECLQSKCRDYFTEFTDPYSEERFILE